MKRIITLLLVSAIMVTIVLAGCSQTNTTTPVDKPAGEGKQEATPKEAGKTTTLSFWTFQELHKQFFDDAVETWNKANPDNKIVLKTDVYPVDEMHNKLLIAMQAGTGAPDIADIEITKFPNFLKGSKPGMVELNKEVEPVKDKLVMGRMDNYAKDGKYYGVDYHVGAQVMYYNTEILGKAGVEVDSIKTWDDYLAAGKEVLSKTGKPMCTIEVTDQWSFYPLISLQGSDYLDKNGNPTLYNDVNVKTLQMFKDMIYKDKIAVPAPGGFHHAEEYWAWMNKGNAASVWMPMWYMGRFTQYMPDLKGKIVIRPMPTFPGGKKSAGMGGTGTVVTTQCKNQELAVAFMANAKLSKEGSIKTWTILGFDPIRADVWNDPAMAARNQYTDYFGTDIFSTLSSIVGDVGAINIGEKFPEAAALISKNVLFKALKEQSKTPEAALKEANDELSAK